MILDWSTKWYAGKKDFSNNLVEDYENDKELLFDYLTMPFRYYFSTCGYAKRVYTDEYGLEEAVYSKGDDHFVIPSWKKARR